ncbi:MAG: hypothetical protein Q9173_004042 [Seirophora scorigena]
MDITIPPESEWLSSNTMSGSDVDGDSLPDMDAKPPVHPVAQMQGAFEESMMETLNESEDAEPQDRMSTADSVSRRKMLLEQEEYQRTVAGRWKQKPGEQFHPLWKLVAQISFGMHLLQQALAKSDEEVIKILQTHVDEIDGFLERTTEDFDLAQGDIDERVRYLKLPLEHGSVFDTMLSERNFRIAIVEGNEKIEHIIDRTAAAMNDALKDVQKGLDATRELAKYLTSVDKQWDDRSEEHDSVYLAMIGNTEGWTRAFLTLQSKGHALRRALVHLGEIVAEMQRRAGAASRKNLVPVRSVQGSRYMVEPQAKSPHHSMTPPKSPLKPLPNPHASTRSSSQQHSQHSSPRSHSGQYDAKQQVKHAAANPRRSSSDIEPTSPRLERAMSAKRVEPILRDTAAEPGKPPKSPKPPMATQTEPVPMISQPQSPASIVTAKPLSPGRRTPSSAGKVPVVVEPPATTQPTKSTDPIIAAHELETKPPIPTRSESRNKPSLATFTERARFHLTRKKSRSQDVEEDDTSSTNLPIQSPTSRDSPAKRSSPPVYKPLSTGRANAISIPTHPATPTSTTNPADGALPRDTSPRFDSDPGVPKPSHSSYGSKSSLPPHPELSPLPDYSTPADEAFRSVNNALTRSTSVNAGTASKPASVTDQQTPVRRATSIKTDSRRTSIVTPSTGADAVSSVINVHPRRSSSINIPHSAPILDDAGGSVNLQHPLLREARHAKFATLTESSLPARGDLPLRHFQSLTNFHSVGFAGRPREIMLPPKRTSSLLYNPPPPTSPSAHPALSSAPLDDDDKLSPAPAQSSATPAPLKVGSRPDGDLETARSSPETATSPGSADSESATPPPISRGARSATPTMARLDTNPISKPQSQAATSPAVNSPSSNKSPNSSWTKLANATSPATSHTPAGTPKFQASATNNIPLYLNPVSSAGLIDFLASTPPPSPPRGQRSITDPKSFDTQNLHRNYRVEDGKPPVAPGPGGMPMLPLHLSQVSPRNRSAAQNPRENGKKTGWKKMFGARTGGGSGGDKKAASAQKAQQTLAAAAAPPKPDSVPPGKKTKSSRAFRKGRSSSKDEGCVDPASAAAPRRHAGSENRNNNDTTMTTNGTTGGNHGIFKMRGFNISRGKLLERRDDDNIHHHHHHHEGDNDNDNVGKMNVAPASPTTTTKTTAAVAGSGGSGVNGNGGHAQSFMGVGKDGMWISRKNFLRT